MKTEEAIRLRIKQLLEENEMTEYRLIRRSNLPPSTVKSVLGGKIGSPRTVTITDICHGFHISVREFYNSELFDNVEPNKEPKEVRRR